MELTITSVDYAPPELDSQLPIVVDLIRKIPGSDRPDYWLGSVRKPIRWLDNDVEKEISHVVLTSRHKGTRIESRVIHLAIGIAYVVDLSVLKDRRLDFEKCKYVAIGAATDFTANENPKKNITNILCSISRALGISQTR